MTTQPAEGSDDYRGVDPNFLPPGEADPEETESSDKVTSGEQADPGQPIPPGQGE